MRRLLGVFLAASVAVAHADSPPDAGPPTQVIVQKSGGERYYPPVLFRANVTKPLEAGMERLREAARVMKEHPELKRLEIVGHADDPGSPARNQWLSEERASAVRRLLIDWGVEPHRLTAVGVGKLLPIAPPSRAGSARYNRRVELIILERDDGSTPAGDTGGRIPPRR